MSKRFNFFFNIKKSPKRKKKSINKNKNCLKLINRIYFPKAYSSMVEHAAHNGLVVGSNPTMPKKFNFKINETKQKKVPNNKN